MAFTDIAKKSILALVAGSTVYYMVRRSQNRSNSSSSPPPASSSVNVEQFHSETITTPVPIPNAGQPGDMKNDEATSL